MASTPTGGLEGSAVIVTGGGTGIGRACAERLAADGAAVTICGRTEAKLVDAAEKVAKVSTGLGEAMPGMKEGSCGEGKCGGAMQSAPKTVEGACAGNKPAPKAAGKATEGKCGEGMCGAMMEGGKMKKGMENMCGAMMKGKEGACGAMQKGEKGAGQEKVSPKDAAGE